jgi:tetratricopeptide (TPR) repeat protein
MKNPFSLAVLCLVTSFGCSQNRDKPIPAQPLTKEQAIEKYTRNGAWKFNMYSAEWQAQLDSGIAHYPEIAYFYQQKAMPYFKQKKYAPGMSILDKAVERDPEAYIDYRAFIKCIFSKSYHDAIVDFTNAKKIKGDEGYVMDHSYDFYIGLSHLQLKEYDLALSYLHKSINATVKRSSEEWVHFLDYFYAGVAYYEQKQYQKAISFFDRSLADYSHFSDCKFYKALALFKSGEKIKARTLLQECETDLKSGYTITEDNAVYERYPYQIDQRDIDNLKEMFTYN